MAFFLLLTVVVMVVLVTMFVFMVMLVVMVFMALALVLMMMFVYMHGVFLCFLMQRYTTPGATGLQKRTYFLQSRKPPMASSDWASK
jgi:hypothetical protein